MGMSTAGIQQIQQEICGNGDSCCGNTAWMEQEAVGIPWIQMQELEYYKMSYVAAKSSSW